MTRLTKKIPTIFITDFIIVVSLDFVTSLLQVHLHLLLYYNLYKLLSFLINVLHVCRL